MANDAVSAGFLSFSVDTDARTKDELGLTQQTLMKNPKSYGSWFHRGWTNEHLPDTPDWKRELELSERFLEKDDRNCELNRFKVILVVGFFVQLFVCVSVQWFRCLFAYLFVCLFVCLPICSLDCFFVFNYLFVGLFLCLLVSWIVCLFAGLFVW